MRWELQVPCEGDRAAWHRAGTAALCRRLGTSTAPRVNNACKIPVLRSSVCPSCAALHFSVAFPSGGRLSPGTHCNVSPGPHSCCWNLSWHSCSSQTGLWGQELCYYWQLLSLLWAEHLQLSARFPSRGAPTSEHPCVLLWSPTVPHPSWQGS